MSDALVCVVMEKNETIYIEPSARAMRDYVNYKYPGIAYEISPVAVIEDGRYRIDAVRK